MADYNSPTVISQKIPVNDITPLEKFILTSIFTCDEEDDLLFFHTPDLQYIDVTTTEEYLERFSSEKDLLSRVCGRGTVTTICIGEYTLILILSEILNRSSHLEQIDIFTSYTCTKLRPDGFGGRRVNISKETVIAVDTHDLSYTKTQSPRILSTKSWPISFLRFNW